MKSTHFIAKIHGFSLAETSNMNHTLSMRLVSLIGFIFGICANFICGFIFRYICRLGHSPIFIIYSANMVFPPTVTTE